MNYADFILEFDEFAGLPQAKVERAIAKAERRIDSSLELAEDLVGFLAAHYLAIADPNRKGAGGISSLNVAGEYSVTYDVGGSSRTFSETSYGREYQRLLDSCVLPSPMVM